MSAHTKEPWSFSNDLNGRVNIFGNGGQQVIFSGAQFINQPNNVRRIVACVNACRSVSNEGLGVMHVRVVGVFKPGKYPARVFYERAWTDPDGKRFGARKLQIATSAAFTGLLRGYRHNFSLEGQ